MIQHKEKHAALKLLAEAGTSLLLSAAQDEEKRGCYTGLQALMITIQRLPEEGKCDCEPYESVETLSIEEALDAISDGHGLYTPRYTYQICAAFNIPFLEELMQHWYSDWSDFKGMHMNDGQEGSVGVYSLDLSRYVAEKLGVLGKARNCMGRGFQARAYAEEVRKFLIEQGGLKDEAKVG